MHFVNQSTEVMPQRRHRRLSSGFLEALEEAPAADVDGAVIEAKRQNAAKYESTRTLKTTYANAYH